jgi:tetratricopeptide (TPR) repeat protein
MGPVARGPAVRRLLITTLLLPWLAAIAMAEPEPVKGTLQQANAALQAGEADKSLALLASLPEGGANIAEAENLQCRVQFTMARWDAAIEACEQALHLNGQDSNTHMWLGRALGEKANLAVFFNAFSLGKRVLVEFQLAAQLDPHNAAALADLGQFYVEAPSVVGGGLGKAESVAQELDRVDPARAQELRADIAEQRKDYAAAERAYKQAVAVSSHPAYELATLSRFYGDRARWEDMDATIQNCISTVDRDQRAGVALYDAAGVLIHYQREPALAATMLAKYVSGPGRSEEAPAFVAYVRLARLKHQLGDAAGAEKDQAEAQGLAHEYTPAQDSRR